VIVTQPISPTTFDSHTQPRARIDVARHVRACTTTPREAAAHALAGFIAAGALGYLIGTWPAALVLGSIGAALSMTTYYARS